MITCIINNNNAVINNHYGRQKTSFFSSKFRWAPAGNSSKFIDNLSTRPREGSPVLVKCNGGIILTGKNRSSRSKRCPIATLPAKKIPTQNGLRLIPGPHGECPATTMCIVFQDSVSTAQETPCTL
jgi:hypothetical protein